MAVPKDPLTIEAISKSSSGSLSTDSKSSIIPDALPQYPYAPLQAGHIRLLQVMSASEYGIFCKMKHVSIEDASVFLALSYVWGDGKPDYTIFVDDEMMCVSQHLAEALRAYYSFTVRQGFGPAHIWIDAICINQNDLEEKSIQVPRMGDIYRRAEIVLIWFGKMYDLDLTSSRIFEWLVLFRVLNDSDNHTMERLDEYMSRAAELELLLADVGVEETNLIALVEMLEVANRCKDSNEAMEKLNTLRESELEGSLWHEDHELWFSLLTFLHHSWFYRIWTIQEIRLANMSFLLLEDSFMSWDLLLWYRHLLFQDYCQAVLYSHAISERVKLTPRPPVFLDLHRAVRFAQGREPITNHPYHNLLIGIRMHGAKNPKDCIYGLLGMLDSKIKSQITIDYSDSTSSEVVFTEALIAACRLEGGVLFWSQLMEAYANISRDLPELPSWVPDFSGHELMRMDQCGPGLSYLVTERYKHLSYIAFPEGLSVAAVRGMCIDSVERIATTRQQVDLDDEASASKTIYDILQLSSVIDMDEDIFSALFGSEQHWWFREMDSVFPPREESPRPGNAEALPAWIWHGLLENDLMLLSDNYPALRDFVEFVHTHGIKNFAEAFAHPDTQFDESCVPPLVISMMSLLRRTSRKHFFRTTSGRVGFAPRRLTPGDHICMIPGASHWLHVLSADKNKYVTALATVEGLMEDSLVDAFPLDEDGWEMFHLH